MSVSDKTEVEGNHIDWSFRRIRKTSENFTLL